MSTFYFNLKDGRAGVLDTEGTDLRDRSEAKDHAIQVARELMKCDEVRKRSWQFDVRDHEGGPLFVVPFATVDPTLNHLEPEFRKLIERLSESRRQLAETVFKSLLLVRHLQAAEARKMGKPYLIAELGRRI